MDNLNFTGSQLASLCMESHPFTLLIFLNFTSRIPILAVSAFLALHTLPMSSLLRFTSIVSVAVCQHLAMKSASLLLTFHEYLGPCMHTDNSVVVITLQYSFRPCLKARKAMTTFTCVYSGRFQVWSGWLASRFSNVEFCVQ